MPMPPGFPTAGDFPADQVKEQTNEWNFHRNPGQGGANFGLDFIAQNEAVIVDFVIAIDSDHHTKGGPDIHLVMKPNNVLQIPVGVHVGHRLEPEGLPGAGATYKGRVVMKIVSPQAWTAKVIAGLPQ